MRRRDFLRAAIAPLFAQGADQWRTFEVTTRVRILKPAGITRLWLPMPLVSAPYQRTLGDTYHASGGRALMVEHEDLDILTAEWKDGVEPILTITNRVATRDHAANLDTPTVPPPLDAHALERFLKPTRLVPLDGIVKATATAITRGAGTDFERSRAIYDSLLADSSPDNSSPRGQPNTRFVGLARSSGIPARHMWGLRLGSTRATKAQHSRAEVYLTGYGWVPVDIMDRSFGSWEMNWMAYNYAHDVVLPGSKRTRLPFFMYPQAETARGPLDSLDADGFKYDITTREIA